MGRLSPRRTPARVFSAADVDRLLDRREFWTSSNGHAVEDLVAAEIVLRRAGQADAAMVNL